MTSALSFRIHRFQFQESIEYRPNFFGLFLINEWGYFQLLFGNDDWSCSNSVSSVQSQTWGWSCEDSATDSGFHQQMSSRCSTPSIADEVRTREQFDRFVTIEWKNRLSLWQLEKEVHHACEMRYFRRKVIFSLNTISYATPFPFCPFKFLIRTWVLFEELCHSGH